MLKQVSGVSSILGRASTVGLEKAVEVLDTLGSSVTSLNASSGFLSSSAAKGNTVCMLAFEVANTIVRGCNLMCSVSKPSIDHLKEVVLRSEGVQLLISKDLDELLKMAAADKRLVPILHFISCILTYSCLLYILPFQIYIERDVLQPLLSSIQILNPLTSTGKS
jgi:hypothetical protein